MLGFALGNGWFRGRLGWGGFRNLYGDELGAFAQLEIEFADGHRQTVVTDQSWTAGPSAVTANDLYDGQTIDARRFSDDWLRPGFAGDGLDRRPSPASWTWPPLDPYIGPPVRRQEELAPVRIWTSPSGKTLVDFGQNLVGWVRVTRPGQAGSTITLRHAEVLEHDELGVRPLRTAKATDQLRPERRRGRLRADLHLPRLPLRRGRGLAGRDRRPAAARGAARRRGLLRAAPDRHLRVLRRAAQPAAPQRRVGHPRQLPRRPDRLPAARRAAGLDRRHRGLRPVGGLPVRRRGLPARLAGRPGRRAAGRRRHGRLRHPRRAEAASPTSARRSRSRTARRSGATPRCGCRGRCGRPTATGRCWRTASTPWPPTPPGGVHAVGRPGCGTPASSSATGWTPPPRRTSRPRPRPTTGWWPPSASTAAPTWPPQAAEVLGRSAEAAEFRRPGRPHPGGVRRALRRRPTARIHSDAATVYALAITFGILDDDRTELAGKRLATLVAESGYHIQTGFAGTPFVTDALTRTGHLDDAYRLLLQTRVPVLALPGDHGRHDHLGALGLDAARRHHQPRPDDQLQPLRPRRGRRLDAPHDRRHRPARAGLRAGAGRPAAGWRDHLGPRGPGDPARTGVGRPGSRSRRAG